MAENSEGHESESSTERQDAAAAGTAEQNSAAAATTEENSSASGVAAATTFASAPNSAAAPAAPARADWRDGEIAKLRAQLERERAKPAAAAAAAPAAPAQRSGESDAEFDARVTARAQQIAEAQRFNQQCEAAAASGRSAFGGDFDARIGQIASKLIDRNDPGSVARYNQFLLDAFDAADNDPAKVAKVMYELGGNLDEAYRVINLSSVKRGAELAKLGSATPASVSGAPKPITPIGSRGERHENVSASDPSRADQLSTATWMERRNAEVAAREAAQRGSR